MRERILATDDVGIDSIVVTGYIDGHDLLPNGPHRTSPPRRPHLRRHRRQQRHRPRRRARARPRRRARRARRARRRQGRGGRRRRSTATTEVRELDLADLASVRAFADALGGRPRRPRQQRRRDGRPRAAHQGRLRDADRHQPPRPLRADQPAAARTITRPRRRRRLGRAPHRARSTSTTSTGSGAATSAGAPTGSPSSPTCCSRSSSSAGSTRRARTSARWPRTPATRRRTCRAAPSNVVQNALMAIGNRVIAQSDEMGALPTLYAATQDLPGDSYVGPDGLRRAARPPEARRPQRRRARRGDRAPAVGALRGADRRGLPAGPGGRVDRRARYFRGAGRLHEACPTSSQCCGLRWNTQSSAR